MMEENCTQAAGKIPATATFKYYNCIQVRVFAFIAGGYVWFMYSYKLYYFTQG